MVVGVWMMRQLWSFVPGTMHNHLADQLRRCSTLSTALYALFFIQIDIFFKLFANFLTFYTLHFT